MAARGIDKGRIAEWVAYNVKRLRRLRRLTLADLSERMRAVGRPMLPSGLSSIEQGTRRVDVDDLIALAIALQVNPNALLLTPDPGAHATAEKREQWRDLWRWATSSPGLDVGVIAGAPAVMDDDPCHGTGMVDCWNPGGPCQAPGDPGCETCGVCATCSA